VAKKRTSLSQTLFGEINPYGVTDSPVEAPQAGQPAALAVALIRPDPNQPRQLLPSPLHQAVAEGRLAPAEALQQWLRQVDEEESDASSKHSVHELRRLATSIEQHGLINPITVRRPQAGESLPAGVEYVIVTGERRYWSHVLLNLEGRQVREGHEVTGPDQIKALVASEGVSVRAHQLIENLLREDINAVEKARGLWALRYELSGVNHGSPPGEETPAGSKAPRGSTREADLAPWARVEETLGISKRYRIFVTSVLNLCLEAQQLVDTHDLSERLIRPIVQKLKDRPDLQLEALGQLVAWREENEVEDGPDRAIVASTQALVDHLLAREAARTAPARPASGQRTTPANDTSGAEQFRSKVQGALRFLNQLEERDLAGLIHDLATSHTYASMVDDLRDLRERLDAILEAIAIQGNRR
jgi:hypothetical protein